MKLHTIAIAAVLALSACGSSPIATVSPSDRDHKAATPARPATASPATSRNDGGFWVDGKFHRYDRLPDKKPPRQPGPNPVKGGRK